MARGSRKVSCGETTAVGFWAAECGEGVGVLAGGGRVRPASRDRRGRRWAVSCAGRGDRDSWRGDRGAGGQQVDVADAAGAGGGLGPGLGGAGGVRPRGGDAQRRPGGSGPRRNRRSARCHRRDCRCSGDHRARARCVPAALGHDLDLVARRLRRARRGPCPAPLWQAQGPPPRSQAGPDRPGGDRRRRDPGAASGLRRRGRGGQPGHRGHGVIAGHGWRAAVLVGRGLQADLPWEPPRLRRCRGHLRGPRVEDLGRRRDPRRRARPHRHRRGRLRR